MLKCVYRHHLLKYVCNMSVSDVFILSFVSVIMKLSLTAVQHKTSRVLYSKPGAYIDHNTTWLH